MPRNWTNKSIDGPVCESNWVTKGMSGTYRGAETHPFPSNEYALAESVPATGLHIEFPRISSKQSSGSPGRKLAIAPILFELNFVKRTPISPMPKLEKGKTSGGGEYLENRGLLESG